MQGKILSALFLVALLGFYGCRQPKSVAEMTESELRTHAEELAQQTIIADGHIDLPDALKTKKFQIGVSSIDSLVSCKDGQFDYLRAQKGGLDAPFMSIYIPPDYQNLPDQGKGLADSLIDMVVGITEILPDKYKLATTPAEIEANTAEGKISLPLGMENGAPIGNDLANLKHFYDRGVRYITLTHNKDNQICDASRLGQNTWNGLSPFGRDVVAEMNRLGMMVDVSHVDDSTFYQTIRLSKAPVIASHSSCRYFTPKAKRNMTDDMIRRLGENKGIIMINFYTSFLDSTDAKNTVALSALLKEKGLESTDALAKPVIEQFRKENPVVSNVETVVNHIEHVIQLAGVDHVGIGSDFDGVDGNLPVGLEDVSRYPNLIYALLKRGYSTDDVQKICSGNLFRVWNKAIEVSEEIQAKNQ